MMNKLRRSSKSLLILSNIVDNDAPFEEFDSSTASLQSNSLGGKVMGYVQKKVAALRGNKRNNGKKTPQREGGNLDFVQQVS